MKKDNTHPSIRMIYAVLRVLTRAGRVVLIGLFLQIPMGFPGIAAPWEDDGPVDMYDDFAGYDWDWPILAIEKIDLKPAFEGQSDIQKGSSRSKEVEKSARFSTKPRQTRPKKLVIFDNVTGTWAIQEGQSNITFVVISFIIAHFHVDEDAGCGTTKKMAAGARAKLERLAQFATWEYFKSGETQMHNKRGHAERNLAYWLDYQCGPGPHEEYLLDLYINTIRDVVRSARKMIIALLYEPHSSLAGIEYGYLK